MVPLRQIDRDSNSNKVLPFCRGDVAGDQEVGFWQPYTVDLHK